MHIPCGLVLHKKYLTSVKDVSNKHMRSVYDLISLTLSKIAWHISFLALKYTLEVIIVL